MKSVTIRRRVGPVKVGQKPPSGFWASKMKDKLDIVTSGPRTRYYAPQKR